jgi:hypothetical protein
MRATCLRNSITTSVVIGLFALPQGLSLAEAQAAVPDNSTKSSVHASAPPAAERAAPSLLLPAPGVSMRSSVSLSPAVAVVNCKFGQSTTQTLTLTNRTDQELVFEMIAEDVIVKDGKRIFVAAGETPGGIAFTAVFSRKEVVIQPLQFASVSVTFTLPEDTPLRAAVALFRGSTKLSGGSAIKMTASLGTLFTFAVSRNFEVESAPLALTPQSATANLGISQVLTNTGSDPFVANGIAAVLNQAGDIVGKATFEPQRLLPGERLPFKAEYSTELKTGHYRVLASFQYEEKVITSSSDFTVP